MSQASWHVAKLLKNDKRADGKIIKTTPDPFSSPGEIIDVEPGEPETLLDAIETAFDFFS
jgi:hypothetical protein